MAFYGDNRPHVGEAFAVNRNLLQLNIANDTFPKALLRLKATEE